MKGLSRLLVLGLLSSSLFAQPAAPPIPPGAPPPPPLPSAPGTSTRTPDPMADLNVAPPVQPGSGGGVPSSTPAVTDDWSTLEGMLGRIQSLQRQALDAIESYKKSTDQAERTMLMRDIQVWHGTIEGMLLSSTWKEIVEKVEKTDGVTRTRDARYLAMFGEHGHLQTVDRNQEILRAFLKDPLAPATTGVSPTAAQGPESIGQLQGQIDQISLELAKPGLTEARRGELEAERTRHVERIRALSATPGSGTPASTGGAPESGSAPEPSSSTGGPAGDPASTRAPGTGDATTGAPPAAVGLVPNSYGVAPQVLTDAQIRAALDPLIDHELATVNAKSGGGLTMNKYRQMTGRSGKTTVKSVGRPDYDHYREWLKASPTLKAEIDKRARAIHDERARTLAPRPPAQNPASKSDR